MVGGSNPLAPTNYINLLSSPTPGSGKGKLVDMVASIATGSDSTLIGYHSEEAELEKRLGAALMAGDRVVCLDNVSGLLYSDFMCSLLTRETVHPRVLGLSKIITTSTRTTLMVTGNNLRVRDDLTRRFILIRIDPRCEHPEERPFDFDPVALAKEKRADVIHDVLTIAKAFICVGRPPQSCRNMDYPEWTRMIRWPLLWLGEPDPAETTLALRDDDPDKQAMIAVLAAWYDVYTDKPQFADTVVSTAQDLKESEQQHPLFDALLVVAEHRREHAICKRRLGKWLSKICDRYAGDYHLAKVGDKQSAGVLWRVTRTSNT